MSGVSDKDGEKAGLHAVVQEKDLQIEALLAKMDEMKRSLDELSVKNFDNGKLLEQMNSADFAKQNMILKRENAELRKDLAIKNQYAEDLKQNIKIAMQRVSAMSSGTDFESSAKEHAAIFSQLLENLSLENMRGRRIIEELSKREGQCQRRWNQLLQENLNLQSKNDSHQSQTTRQREQFQAIIHQNERKLLEANQLLAAVTNADDKRQAAEYLVEQIRQTNEEK